MRRRTFLTSFLAACLLLAPMHIVRAAPADTEREFVLSAAASADVEMKSAQLAVNKAANDAVRNFGRRMVDENGASRERILKLANAKSIELPTKLPAKELALLERLQGMSGLDFDRAYMAAMVDMHHHDVKIFGDAAQRFADAEIKAFAVAELPLVRQHLQLARDVADAVGAPMSPLAQ